MAILTDSYLMDLLGLITAFITISFVYFKWAYQYWKKRNIPYIEPTIPFGNIENPFRTTNPFGERIADIYNIAKSKGWRHCGIYVMASPTYLVVDLELVKHVLTKDFNHFVDRGVYTNEKVDPIGCHLFALDGTRWKNLRAKLTPTFTSGKLKAMFQTVVDCGLIFENYVEQHLSNKEAVDIKEILAYLTTDVIGSCAFGIDCNTFKNHDSPFLTFGKKVFTETKIRAAKLLFSINFPRISRALGMRQVPKEISDFYSKVVEDTVTYRERNNFRRNDFMQLLIDAKNNKESEEIGDGKTLTMNEIIAQSFVFFIAGYETSSTTMTFALFELASQPEIQTRLRKEINMVLGRHNNQITYDSLSELTYMEQVIDETLRVHSPGRFLQRLCVKDYKVEGEDVVIEKGTNVLISIRGIHYDEEYHKNPKVFDPERFNSENRKNMPQYAHLPFGHGPRMCIGERFAIMEVKVGLTCLLRKFKVTLNEKTKVPLKMTASGVVSTAEGGIWLNIEKV